MTQQIEMTIQEEAVALGFVLQHGEFARSLHLRAVQHVQDLLDKSGDPLRKANQIIVAFGCTPVADENQARIIAKGLAEQVVLQGLTYDAEVAMKIVAGKLINIERTYPWMFVSRGSSVTPTTGTPTGVDPSRVKAKGPKRGGDKKERALEIFNTFNGKKASASDIAKEIQAKLEISFANAYYYVTRVFNYKVTSDKKAKKGAK